MSAYGIVILAAGASTRLGQPKQLLEWQGKSLLQHVSGIAAESVNGPVVVVLGEYADELTDEPDESARTVLNLGWQEGIASSIRCGLSSLLEITPAADGVIFLVCDQPHVTTELLKELVATHSKTHKPIVASKYANTLGIPALFDKTMFPELVNLQGDTGAKSIIHQYIELVETVAFPLGHIDIDTASDYEALQQQEIKAI
jgi:molybdenum cofactor cytidylyltransferase